MRAEEPLLDEAGRAWRELFSLRELVEETGLSDRTIQHLLALGLIDPLERRGRDEEPVFPASVLPRIHRILRLHGDLRLNYASLGLVLDLLDRVAELEREAARRR